MYHDSNDPIRYIYVKTDSVRSFKHISKCICIKKSIFPCDKKHFNFFCVIQSKMLYNKYVSINASLAKMIL